MYAEFQMRSPVRLWLLTGVWALLMLAATALWPATYGLDEPQHVDMAYAYTDGLRWYGPGERALAEGVLRAQLSYRGYPPAGALGDSLLADRGVRPTLRQLGEPGVPASSAAVLPNQMVQHPPAYYLLGAGVLLLPGVADLPFDQQVGLLRLVSLVLLLPLPALCWATARRLELGPPVALAAAALPLGLPGLVRVGAAVTNDSLAVLLTGGLTWLLARVVTGDLSRRTAAAIAVVLALDLLTKGFALVLPPLVLLAYLVGWRRYRTRVPLIPALIAGSGAVVGGLWWVRNLVVYGAVQPSGYGVAEDVLYGPRRGGSVADFWPAFADGMARRVWGGLGFLDAPAQPPLLVYGPVAIAAVAVAVALVARRPPPLTRLTAALLVAPAALVVVLTGMGALSRYRAYGQLVGVQGRYVYVGLVGLAVAVAAGLAALLRTRAVPALPAAVLTFALVAQLSAFLLVANSWWAPAAPGLGPSLTAAASGILRVSPWSPTLTALPFGSLALLAAVTLMALVRDARQPDPDLPGEAGETTSELADELLAHPLDRAL